MKDRRITFRSPEVSIRTIREIPYAEVVEGWTVSEEYRRDGTWVDGNLVGAYRVLVSKVSKDDDALGSDYIAGCAISRSVNQAFVYTTGRTLARSGYDIFLQAIDPPDGWESNAKKVIPNEDWKMLQGTVAFASNHRNVEELPLRRALEALQAVGDASDIVQHLWYVHGIGLTIGESDLPYLMFAQALEIIRELLPGKGDKAKQAGLPDELRDAMTHEFKWLFTIAQQRRQTRHLIDKKDVVSLKPNLSHEEERSFLHDAELVIRYVLCRELGITMVYPASYHI